MAIQAIAAGGVVASSLLGLGSKRKQRRRTKRAEAMQRRRAQIANIQSRRAAASALRRQIGAQRAVAIATGMQGGSSSFATASSVAASSQAEIGKQLHQESMGNYVNATLGKANRAADQASNIAALGSIAQSGLRIYGSL